MIIGRVESYETNRNNSTSARAPPSLRACIDILMRDSYANSRVLIDLADRSIPSNRRSTSRIILIVRLDSRSPARRQYRRRGSASE
jgi:hypothetical protein